MIMCSCVSQKIFYFDKLALENTEICKNACVEYNICGSLLVDGYLIQRHSIM